jgi:hypothetical protein
MANRQAVAVSAGPFRRVPGAWFGLRVALKVVPLKAGSLTTFARTLRSNPTRVIAPRFRVAFACVDALLPVGGRVMVAEVASDC